MMTGVYAFVARTRKPARGDGSAVLSRWQCPRATTERGLNAGPPCQRVVRMRQESPARWAPVATGARFVAAATAQRKARDTREPRLSLSREKPIEKGASAHFSIDTAGAGAAAP